MVMLPTDPFGNENKKSPLFFRVAEIFYTVGKFRRNFLIHKSPTGQNRTAAKSQDQLLITTPF